jgi:hypothetical protein
MKAFGGAGIRIGPPKPSAADYALASMTENRRWLEAECARMAAGPA